MSQHSFRIGLACHMAACAPSRSHIRPMPRERHPIRWGDIITGVGAMFALALAIVLLGI